MEKTNHEKKLQYSEDVRKKDELLELQKKSGWLVVMNVLEDMEKNILKEIRTCPLDEIDKKRGALDALEALNLHLRLVIKKGERSFKKLQTYANSKS